MRVVVKENDCFSQSQETDSGLPMSFVSWPALVQLLETVWPATIPVDKCIVGVIVRTSPIPGFHVVYGKVKEHGLSPVRQEFIACRAKEAAELTAQEFEFI